MPKNSFRAARLDRQYEELRSEFKSLLDSEPIQSLIQLIDILIYTFIFCIFLLTLVSIWEQYERGDLTPRRIRQRLRGGFYRTYCCLCSISLGAWAIPFPPIVVWYKRGCCSGDLPICIALCMMGWIPGVIFAWHVLATTGDLRKTPREAKQQNSYTVEKVKSVDMDDDGRPMYLVSWKGYYSDEDTWEYAGNVDREALMAFRAKNAAARERRRSSSRSRSGLPKRRPTVKFL